MRAWLVTACLGLCAAGCAEPSTTRGSNPTASAATRVSSQSSAAHSAAAAASRSATATSPAGGGGGNTPHAALPAPSASAAPATSAAASARAASGEPAAQAEPISRGLVATALAAKPPRPARGEPRGPIDTGQDGAWLRRMSHAAITKASQNKGGSTVTIRVYFEDGYRAVFKADQTRTATNYRSEIVAYHLDRLLGCARTAPVVGRRINRAALRSLLLASDTDADFMARVDAELRDAPTGGAAGGATGGDAPSGDLRGALIAWHNQPLHSLPVPRGWTKWLAAGAEAPDAMRPALPALAELTVFDYLLDNTDRWSGGNVLLLGAGGPVIFLDNGAGFADWRMQKQLRLDADLAGVCEFPRGLLRNLEAMAPSRPQAERLSSRLERSLRRDPLAPVLSPAHLAAIDERAGLVLAHVSACEAKRLASPEAADSAAPTPKSSAAPQTSAEPNRR